MVFRHSRWFLGTIDGFYVFTSNLGDYMASIRGQKGKILCCLEPKSMYLAQVEGYSYFRVSYTSR